MAPDRVPDLLAEIDKACVEIEEQNVLCQNERDEFNREQPPEGAEEIDAALGPCSSCQWNMRVAGLLRAAAEALRQSQEAQGWQPIETAPKDGTKTVIGFTWAGHVHPVYWSVSFGRWNWVTDGYHSGAAPRLTHWMPLPAPPRETPECAGVAHKQSTGSVNPEVAGHGVSKAQGTEPESRIRPEASPTIQPPAPIVPRETPPDRSGT